MAVPLRATLLYTGVALLSLVAGVFTAKWLESNQANNPAASNDARPAGVPERRVDFSLMDLNGQRHSLGEWDKKVILLNFWATWCPPCRNEMPDFIDLKQALADQPFEVIGVALDRKQPVQDFVDEIGVEYPVLLAEIEGMQLMQAYGNQLMTLPYTVIIDQNGNIVKTFRTEVNKKQMLAVIKPLLKI